MAVVTVPYRPRNWAKSFHAGLVRFVVLVLHRRAGKTTALMNQHLRAAMDDNWERARLLKIRPSLTEGELEELLHPPGGRHYGHVMPTRVQAKQTTWDRLKFYAAPIPGVKPNESELLLRLPNGNKIQLFGADDPDSLRGMGPSGISFDEFSQQPSNIFSEIISKALADHLGYAIFAGTIKGKDHLYQAYTQTEHDPSWIRLWQDVDVSLATEEGVTIQNLETAMEDDRKQIAQGLMTQDEYDQEWYLSPEASIKGAWFGKEMLTAKQQGRITRVPYDPGILVDTDWDLGVDDAMAIWFSQSLRSGEIRLIDYYEASGEGFPHYVSELSKRGYTYGKHYPPHDIAVREMGSGKTRKAVAAELGLRFEEPVVAPSFADGINAARLCLAKCWMDSEKAAKGIESLRNYRKAFNKRLNEFTGTPVHNWASHGADAFRGLAVRHRTPEDEQRDRGEYVAMDMGGNSWMGL